MLSMRVSFGDAERTRTTRLWPPYSPAECYAHRSRRDKGCTGVCVNVCVFCLFVFSMQDFETVGLSFYASIVR